MKSLPIGLLYKYTVARIGKHGEEKKYTPAMYLSDIDKH
jgi:hypothetical protein